MIKIVVHAENIKIGGGLVLLSKLIETLPNEDTFFILNNDLSMRSHPKHVTFVENKILLRLRSRFSVEYPDALHIHFGNLPPIFSKSRNVLIYLQNALLIEGWEKIKSENLSLKVRLLIERLFLRIFMRKNYRILVQTQHMLKLAKYVFPRNKIELLKFSDIFKKNNSRVVKSPKPFRIVYIGGNEKYKNFINVLLGLTVFCRTFNVKIDFLAIGPNENEFKNLFEPSVENLSITFEKKIERKQIFDIFRNFNLLIFSSNTESFGLPLVEADYYGLDIIATDADYVLESCRPKFLFNPADHGSLVRALTLYFELNDFPNLTDSAELRKKIINS
jgi:hypothetical protein